MNWKFYLMMAYPSLEMVSRMLAQKDADNVGPDDKAAAFLHYASVAIQAIINDQPLPQPPAALLAK